jgi:hypothetical protein
LGREFNLSLEDIKSFYNEYLGWLCWQSKANPSLPAIAEMQGDFAKLQAFHPPGKVVASQRLG